MSVVKVTTKNEIVLIEFEKDDPSIGPELQNLSQDWLGSAEKLYVFDFSGFHSLHATVVRAIVILSQGLKKQGSVLTSISVGSELQKQITGAGLDSVFSVKHDLESAKDFAGIHTHAKPAIDVNFVNPFIKATVNTLEIQAQTKLTAGKPRIKSPGEGQTTDIAGVISLVSNSFQGSIALCFPEKVFLFIYSNMLGSPVTELTKDVEDGAGELLNIIFGQAKAELNDNKAFAIQKAVPTVVRGNQISIHHLGRNLAVILPFETAAGPFHIEISVE